MFNCFDTEGDILDSTVLVDNITDCIANDDQEKMGELDYDSILVTTKDYKVKDMTVNTKSNKRLTCSVCCLLATTERESITVHFGIYLKQLHILKLIIVGQGQGS